MFPEKKPRKGKVGQPTWSFESFAGGGSAKGWLAAQPVWVTVHYKYRSIPCYTELTDGELDCPYCGRVENTFDTGYLPWYDPAGKPFCSAVREYSAEIIARIDAGAPIVISKGERKFDPVVVEPSKWSRVFEPTPVSRRSLAQFEQWLLVLWKEVPLQDWFRDRCDKALSQDQAKAKEKPKYPLDIGPEAREGGAKELKDLARLIGKRIVHRPEDPPTIGDILPPAERNGKH